jgi:DNA-directed RNA polymerase specialized sigma24 family protein
MSAALQLPTWEAGYLQAAAQIATYRPGRKQEARPEAEPQHRPPRPAANLAFYRKHTVSLLRRYLYASLQVGRAPSILSDPVCRGWASNHPVHTFEDALIFVLDIESCLSRLDFLDREILSKLVIQEYPQTEVAALLGVSLRHMANRFGLALDRLTEKLLASKLLIIPR